METFEVSDNQLEKLEKWQDEMTKKDPSNFTAGERWTFCFTPTGLGTMLHVKDNITHEQLDLTEWEYF